MSVMSFREPNQVKWVGVRPAHNGEQITKFGNVTDDILVLYTVPSGKTFYLSSWQFEANTSASGVYGVIYITDASGATYYAIQRIGFNSVSQFADSGTFYPPMELPGGYSIKISSNSTSLIVRAGFFGWEE